VHPEQRMALEIRILGPTEVIDGERRVDLPAGHARAVLAILALHVGAVVSSDRLIDELWADGAPPTAATIVQGQISRLRKLLEPGRKKRAPSTILRTVAPGYVLDLEPDAVDAHRFQRLLGEARHADDAVRSALLADALRLWRGSALADFTYEPFAQRAIMALEEARLAATELRIDADLTLRRHAALVPEIEQLVAHHPFRERFREQLMLALYRSGRQADALEAYRDAHRTLTEEMGLEPSPSLQRLERAILRHDPTLELRHDREEEGASQHVAAWLPAERKRATVVFTSLRPAHGATASPDAAVRAHDAAAAVLRRHGGRVEEIAHDSLVGFFGLPAPGPEDGLRAVRAAVELRAAIDDVEADAGDVTVVVSSGIDTGTVVVGLGDEVPSGRVVMAAARLQHAAEPGDVLVGAATQHLLRGSVVLKPVEIGTAGSGDAVFAWRVLDIAEHAMDAARSPDHPLFGRAAELTHVRTAFRRCLRSGKPYRLTILGEPGVGTSRLAKEFVASIGPDARVLSTRCRPFGDETGALAVRDLLVGAVGPLISETSPGNDTRGSPGFADDALVARARAVQTARPEGLPSTLRSLLEMLAESRPLIVLIEDLHLASPGLLDAVDQIGREGSGLIFLLCLAESQLMTRRRGWAEPLPYADLLLLDPLRDADMEDLVRYLAGSAFPDETVGSIVAASRGIPLVAEQLLAAADEEGIEPTPTSLRGLLTMRLARLAPGERETLRCAAVLGDGWTDDTIRTMLPVEAHPFVERHLDALERKRLIVREGARTFRSAHALIQIIAHRDTT
jgi:DNA-binding SARP family transcriptional activator